jgi:replicative DNA helicase
MPTAPVSPADVLSDRMPPASIEAEMSVLGSMILNPNCIGEIIETIDEDVYFRHSHGLIHTAIVDIFLTQRGCDLVILKEELTRRGSLEKAGGLEYLVKLVETVPTSANALDYARIVRDKAILRKLIETCDSVIREARVAGEDADKLLDKAQSLIFEVAAKKGLGDVKTLKEILHETFQKIADLHDRKSRLLGLSTGFYGIDDMLSGLQASQLYIVAARPSMGKTSLAMRMAEHVAVDQGKPVLFFSLEMASQQIAQQMLCMHTRVDSHKLRTGMIAEEEYQKLMIGAGRLAEAPILIDDSADLSILELRARSRRMKAEHGIELIVIDYLQKVHAKAEAREREIAIISSQLKSLSKELAVPVVVLAQLNRQPEGREDKKPILSDLRESGSIEQDADVVMLLYRPEYYDRSDSAEKNTCDIIVAKNRTGPTGDVKLAFIKEYTRFENLTQQQPGPG